MVVKVYDTEQCSQRHLDVLPIIKNNPAFKDLDTSELEDVAGTFRQKRFPEHYPVIEQDNEIGHIVLIINGSARVMIRDHFGLEHDCGRLDAGDFIVSNGIFTGDIAIGGVISLEPIECLVQKRSDFLAMLKKYPVLKDFFYRIPISNVRHNYQTIFKRNPFNGIHPVSHGRIPKNIKTSLQIINRRYTESITLEELAKESGTSRYYLSRLFKKYAGCSFKEYLNLKRVEAAKQLMEEKDLNISEACFRVGYNDLSLFLKDL